MFKDFPILVSLSALSFFFSFREKLIGRFKQLFEGGTDEETEQKTLAGKWGWYNLIFGLCGENILHIEPVTKLEIALVLTYLSYQQDKSNIERNNYNKHK